jgi:hypothetical protein
MAPMFLLASHNAQEGLPEKMIRQCQYSVDNPKRDRYFTM